MTTYTNPFTGQTVSPAQVSYESLSITTNTYLEWPVNGNNTSVVSNIIEITTGANTGLSVYMPSAQQVSVGQATIIKNTGSNPFTVRTVTGTTIISIASGISQYIYVTNNTTDSGTWSTVTFGAGTSSADAGSLAGYGLVALGTTLNQAYTVTNTFSSSALLSTQRAQFIVYDGGAGTLTLPSASAVGNNWFCMIRNNGTGIVTVAPVGSSTINGAVNAQLQLTESFVIVCDGSNWNTFGYGRSNTFAYTQLALVVTGGTLTESATQAASTIQSFTGTLTSNQIIVVPSTVQLYTMTNNTTGSFTFTVKTSAVGGATVTISQGDSLVIVCDGTNVYNAASGSSSVITSLTLGNGSLSVPSLKFAGDLNSGMYLPASNQVGFVIGNALAGSFTTSGFTATNGISGGVFT
jgi:hypothetical protein